MNFTFLSGTGSNQYQPASGTYPSLRVSIEVENYSGSHLSEPSSSFSLERPSGMTFSGRSVQWASDSTIFNYNLAGGPNYGPGDRFLSGSFKAVPIDFPEVFDTFSFTVQQEQLNGCRFEDAPTSSLASSTTKFTCSVFYWGLDEYNEIVSPEVGEGPWTLTEVVFSNSVDEYGAKTSTREYHFTGSRNEDPGDRTQSIEFSCYTPRKDYDASIYLSITQSGQGYPTDLYVTSDTVPPGITISGPTEGTLYKNGEVIMEDIFYPRPDGTSASLNLADLARPYVETYRGLGGNQRRYPDNFRYEDSNGTEVGPVAIIAGNSTPYFLQDYSSIIPVNVFRLLSPWGDNMKFAPFGPIQGTLFNCSESPQQIKVSTNNRAQTSTITIEPGQIYTPRRIVSCNIQDVEIWHETLGTIYKWNNRVDDATYTLYWVNSWGGISSYPFTGRIVGAETQERYNIINPRLYKYNYKNGVEARYRLSTGLLWDEISLKELFSSTYVYIYSIYPGGVVGDVWIDANTIEYKTFKNQGRQVPEYEFEIVACQQKEVR